MRRIKIVLPAAITNLGPGINTLGLALSLHTTIEITERRDNQLVVETEGEGAGHYSIGLRHPVVLAMMRVFQKQERAPLGITLRVSNQIPLYSGLGVEAAFLAGGVIGANNLLGNPYSREQLLEIAAQISRRPDSVLATLLGGLTTGILKDERLIYRTLPVTSLRIVVVLPDLPHYHDRTHAVVPTRILLDDAVHNLQRLPLLVEGLRTGNLGLIADALDDRLQAPYLTTHISGYGHVVETARRAGAAAVAPSGGGPALLVFTHERHDLLAEALVMAFTNAGVKARAWVLNIDTQGVVISVMQSA
jgi:homoserine kinase